MLWITLKRYLRSLAFITDLVVARTFEGRQDVESERGKTNIVPLAAHTYQLVSLNALELQSALLIDHIAKMSELTLIFLDLNTIKLSQQEREPFCLRLCSQMFDRCEAK